MDKLREFYRTGDIFIWFTGFGLAMILAMIAGLLVLVVVNSTEYFYPSELALIETKNIYVQETALAFLLPSPQLASNCDSCMFDK